MPRFHSTTPRTLNGAGCFVSNLRSPAGSAPPSRRDIPVTSATSCIRRPTKFKTHVRSIPSNSSTNPPHPFHRRWLHRHTPAASTNQYRNIATQRRCRTSPLHILRRRCHGSGCRFGHRRLIPVQNGSGNTEAARWSHASDHGYPTQRRTGAAILCSLCLETGSDFLF